MNISLPTTPLRRPPSPLQFNHSTPPHIPCGQNPAPPAHTHGGNEETLLFEWKSKILEQENPINHPDNFIQDNHSHHPRHCLLRPSEKSKVTKPISKTRIVTKLPNAIEITKTISSSKLLGIRPKHVQVQGWYLQNDQSTFSRLLSLHKTFQVSQTTRTVFRSSRKRRRRIFQHMVHG